MDFLICDRPGAILGVDTMKQLKLAITQIGSIEVQQTTESTREIKTDALPKIRGFKFRIDLKENAPKTIIQRPRRLPLALEKPVEEEIASLLRSDIIEAIDSSPFVSPIVVVPKGDSIRLCVDYRAINQHIIIPSSYSSSGWCKSFF